jgi:hypothetical protein
MLSALGLVTAALVLLTAGLSSLELQPARTLPVGAILQALRTMRGSVTGFGQLPFDPFRLLASFLWVALIFSAIMFIISPEVRREVIKKVMIYLVWALLIYGIVQVFQPFGPLELAGNETEFGGEQLDNTALEEIFPAPPDFVFNPPQWLVLTATVLFVAVPLLAAWLVWSYFRSKKTVPPADSLAELTRSAKTALDDLEAGRDLHNTVLRCYRDMSQALAQRRQLHRARGMTPREFEQHLAASGLRTEHIHRLTELFERVRYGKKSLGRREELDALDCLSAIVKTYGRPQ